MFNTFITFETILQWVTFVMLIQAATFMAPYQIWKFLEGRVMEDFGIGHHNKHKVFLNQETEKYVQKFRKILNKNNTYFIKFVLCEILNFIILMANHSATDTLLNGQFYYYGREVMTYYK